MKIRHKITLWISVTTLLATLAFSSFIFFELLEEPIRLIDKELQYMADSLFEQARDDMPRPWIFNGHYLPYSPDRYWIKIFDQDQNILYASAITRYTDIPPSGDKTSYNIERTIPEDQIRLGQDAHNEVVFRVRVVETQIGGLPVMMRIAKPVEELEEELLEVLEEVFIGLAIAILCIIILSYTLAGKILQPVVSINRLVGEIREKSLDRRIPISSSRDELATLSVSINQMFDRLQYSFNRQKEFVGNASHELKSPITLLMLTQEELLMNDDLPEATRKDLERQLYTLRRMSRLIRNLLDLSRLEQQEPLAVESVDLVKMIEKTLEEYQEMLTSKCIIVKNDLKGDMSLMGDPEKLQRLLINLIDNAIRYNKKKDGQLIISGKKEKDFIHLEIANTGQGIPKEDIGKVFDQFYRVEKSRSTGNGGSGLGLTIAQKIVELHYGNISISSGEGGLTRVTVILPIECV